MKYEEKYNMKLSIVTVCYNAEQCIDRTIKSVLNQTCPVYEYIIIDGGSKDKTYNRVCSYEKSFAEKGILFKHISERDKGISDAFNKGIKMASGTLIGLINADDELLPETSEILKNECKKIDVDIYYGNCYWVDSERNLEYVSKPKHDLSKLLYNMVLIHPSTFVKKKAYEECGFKNKISNIVERFKELSENWKKLLQEKAQLPEKGFNDKDRKKLTRLKKNFIRDLQDYEYTSISNVSAIEISDDNYLPVIDNFDMKFGSSASDNVRAIWAYTMALLQTSEKCGGNHPGLLIFDEPAQHSIGAVDTKAFFDSILNLGDNCQVIIGITINNADIREVISEIGEEKCNVVNIGEKAFE